MKKNLIVYSSLTGNTKKIAEAIAEVMPDCEIYPIEKAPEPKGYGLISIGYWVDKGMPDTKAKRYMESITNANVALFGTLGAYPDSNHAKDCINKGEELLKGEGKNNNVVGSFMCQGKVDPKLIEHMAKLNDGVHSMTPERIERLAEAAKHPNEEDCNKAKEIFSNFVVGLEM